jgi:exodeoxyribonuclease V alpha subunit
LIIRYAHQINRGEVPRIASPLANPHLWKEQVDCLFIDAEEATQEQATFLRRAKQAITATVNGSAPRLLQTGEQVWGQMIKADESIRIDELYVPTGAADELKRPLLCIPEKFRHVDLETLAHSSGDIDELKQVLRNIHPWSSLHYGLTALDTILRLYTKTIPEFYGRSCEMQILTPQVRGTLGTLSLNQQIQAAVNPEKPGRRQLTIGEKIFREGDRVIQTRNNYDLAVFNGDIGRIEAINPDDYSCEIHFAATGAVRYEKEDLTELSLAYAVTIHKAQGSEFDTIIIPVTSQHFKMLFRNLIYTGLTRAKKLAVFVGSRRALAMAVRTIDSRKRQTALSYLVADHALITRNGL